MGTCNLNFQDQHVKGTFVHVNPLKSMLLSWFHGDDHD